jgi:hypothetical protein
MIKKPAEAGFFMSATKGGRVIKAAIFAAFCYQKKAETNM